VFFERTRKTSKILSRILAAALLPLFIAGCSRQPKPQIERLAILPFENLGQDSSLDWIGHAASDILAAQITGSQKIHAVRITVPREAPLVRATRILHGYFAVSAGRLRLHASLEQVDENRIIRTFSAEGRLSDGVLPLADSIADRIEPRAQPFGTQDPEALKAFVEGRTSSDPAAAVARFERAVAADPDFGAAYTGWVQALIVRGDRAGADRVIDMARARGNQIREIDLIRLDLVSAILHEDAAARSRALVALTRLTPTDADVFRSLGRLEVTAHRYTTAIDRYRKAAALDPSNPGLWNNVGYTEAFARNLEAARKALREYEKLVPHEANPLDSLGDVHFYFGKFADAEKFYLQAYEKNAAFLGGATLYKAAGARLMTGDVRGAEELFRRFTGARQMDPLLEYRQAQWEYLLGPRQQAVARMAGFAKNASRRTNASSIAYSQLSAWSLANGDLARARNYAVQADAVASSTVAQQLAALCRFLAEPKASPSELVARAQHAFPDSNEDRTRRLALGYGFLLGKHFPEAARLFRELWNETDPASPDRVNVLLAWALVETGQIKEAAELLENYWIPSPGPQTIFAFFTFPRIFLLRSAVLEKQGRRDEANRDRDLFHKLSANQPVSQ
jgi:tetratricopeptide (TPR) repeat protein